LHVSTKFDANISSWSWDANANCPPDFVMFQNFKHEIACITMQYKAYQPHSYDSVFTALLLFIPRGMHAPLAMFCLR